MHDVSIRTAEPADIAALRGVFRRSSLSNAGDRANLLANPDALELDEAPVYERRTRVALDADRIVGFATTRELGDIIELDDLFVDPEWMRRGVGRCLIADVVAFGRSHGAARVEVTANGHAMEFYAAPGSCSTTSPLPVSVPVIECTSTSPPDPFAGGGSSRCDSIAATTAGAAR